MELSDLKYFKIVSELQSFTKAANTLYTSQPAVSRKIKSLEDELGVRLFERKGRKILLNENGEVVLKHTNLIFNTLHNMKTELENNYSICIILKIGLEVLPDIIQQYKRKCSKSIINVILYRHDNAEIYDWDFSIFCHDSYIEDESTELLFTEKILLAVNKDSYLCNFEKIYLSDLINEKFTLIDYDNVTGKRLDDLFNQYDFKPNVIFNCDNYDYIKKVISNGLGIAFVPSFSLGFNNDPNIKLLEVCDMNIIRYVYLAESKVRHLSKAVYNFIDFVIDYFKNTNTNPPPDRLA